MSQKQWREQFARLFESPSRETLRDLLRNHIGELNECDFKESWPELSKVARDLLAFANSGGGCLVVGVVEREDGSFEAAGLPQLLDKTDLANGVMASLPRPLKYEVLDFSFEESEYPTLKGKQFQVLLVDDLPVYLPFVALADGQALRKAAIYVRRGVASVEVDYEGLQDIINRRIATGAHTAAEMDLDRHLQELAALYRRIPRFRSMTETASVVFASLSGIPNPQYPPEDFDAFVARLTQEKKEAILGIIRQR